MTSRKFGQFLTPPPASPSSLLVLSSSVSSPASDFNFNLRPILDEDGDGTVTKALPIRPGSDILSGDDGTGELSLFGDGGWKVDPAKDKVPCEGEAVAEASPAIRALTPAFSNIRLNLLLYILKQKQSH